MAGARNKTRRGKGGRRREGKLVRGRRIERSTIGPHAYVFIKVSDKTQKQPRPLTDNSRVVMSYNSFSKFVGGQQSKTPAVEAATAAKQASARSIRHRPELERSLDGGQSLPLVVGRVNRGLPVHQGEDPRGRRSRCPRVAQEACCLPHSLIRRNKTKR